MRSVRHRGRGEAPARPSAARLPSISLILVAGLVFGACTASPPASRPNVLIIVSDALRGDALGVNGYPLDTTPNLDAVVRGGAVNFRRAYAHSTWTKPSIATLFTSLYPSHHGIHLVAAQGAEGKLLAQSLDPSFTTLAEAFRAAGYQTGAVVNQVHLQGSGFSQGFDEYTALRGKGASGLNARLLQWLDGVDRKRPFFAYLHYLDTHWPYQSRLASDPRDFGPTELDPEPPKRGKAAERWAAAFDEQSLRPLRARYDLEVAFVDMRIEALRRGLARRGLAADTIVVITADHGEGFLEHGKILHSYEPYAEVAHVPLILDLPAGLQAETTDIDAPVGLVDLMPTLLELASIEVPPGLQGRSLVPLLHGFEPRRKNVYSNGGGVVAVRGERYAVLGFGDHVEAYDEQADPEERRPLADCPAACRQLVHEAELYARLLAAMDEAALGVELSPEDVKELRELGYL
jgi:arylsulfatase A-like enzyme